MEQVTYESVGYARVRVDVTGDGVALLANRDGLESLIRVLTQLRDMADRGAGHIHLTPSLQLEAESAALVLARLEDREEGSNA